MRRLRCECRRKIERRGHIVPRSQADFASADGDAILLSFRFGNALPDTLDHSDPFADLQPNADTLGPEPHPDAFDHPVVFADRDGNGASQHTYSPVDIESESGRHRLRYAYLHPHAGGDAQSDSQRVSIPKSYAIGNSIPDSHDNARTDENSDTDFSALRYLDTDRHEHAD